ncbi:MAG: nucleoside deaminase [Sphingobacteriales bacterium]|nr:MAG: nucleoside deaminase [Sphingobacteriales bacterium]TAF80299.1 MAG: nucleoside deaminase [Sphingobacteriales bacterium]
MQPQHQKFMQLAIELSKANVKYKLGGPFGAVITKNGHLIAQSANKVVPSNDPTAHAEIVAIRLACKVLNTYDLTGCTIYTSCEPCPMCLGAIYWAHIDTMYYANNKNDAAKIGFDDAFIYAEMDIKPEIRKLKSTRIMAKEAFEVFKLWQTTEAKTHY